MIRAKRFILFAVLGLMVVWPLAHYGIVDLLDLDPWRFCGFAMYATPSTYQWVLIVELRGDKEVHLHDSWFSEDFRKLYRKYKRRRSMLGKLAPPHELAQAIMEERPDIEALKIILIRDVVSPETSRMIALPGTAFVYRR